MKTIVFVVFSLLLTVIPQPGVAHFDDEVGLVVLMYDAKAEVELPEGQSSVGLLVINSFAKTATLRKLSIQNHGTVEIEKMRNLLFVKSWQTVQFLRFEPGQEQTIEPPRYRIKIPTGLWQSDDTRYSVDFGPLGLVEAYKVPPSAVSDNAIGQ